MGIVTAKLLAFLFANIAVCLSRSCLFFQEGIYCPKTGLCITEGSLCDQVNDCKDNSDELYCGDEFGLCSRDEFLCSNGECVPRNYFCDGTRNCEDGSDELFCSLNADRFCPSSWDRCANENKCIPPNFQCDQIQDCVYRSDEINCELAHASGLDPNGLRSASKEQEAVDRNVPWLLNRRKNVSSSEKWGPELHRIAIALYLGDEHYFLPGNKIGEEMSYELTIQLLSKLNGNSTIRSQELALYIQALLVTCTDPKDFFGHNLVSELRRRVESSNYTNPSEVIALCNAGDTMTQRDIQRVTSVFDSQRRPFWTDSQAIATLALQCLSSSSNIQVDERLIKDMQDELKKRQFRNGTVDNPITTALVIQALLHNESYKEYFDLSGAIKAVVQNQDQSGSWGSIRNSYYVLPALKFKSFLNISSKHCVKAEENEEDVLRELQGRRNDTFIAVYSVWFGNDLDLGRTWRLRMKASKNNSFYDVIEIVRSVTYNVIDNKPYVSALYGKEDDAELGMYWFTYVRSLKQQEDPTLKEASPVDIKVEPHQEIILWYKPGNWRGVVTQEEKR